MTKSYLISLTAASAISGLVGNLTASGFSTADARDQPACEIITYDMTPTQKGSAETLLAAGLRPAAEAEFGEGTFDAKQIKVRGVSLTWLTPEGSEVEVLRSSSHMCVNGSWVAGVPQ